MSSKEIRTGPFSIGQFATLWALRLFFYMLKYNVPSYCTLTFSNHLFLIFLSHFVRFCTIECIIKLACALKWTNENILHCTKDTKYNQNTRMETTPSWKGKHLFLTCFIPTKNKKLALKWLIGTSFKIGLEQTWNCLWVRVFDQDLILPAKHLGWDSTSCTIRDFHQ